MQKWLHAPEHRFNEKGIYMVTAGTYQKAHFFKSDKELELLQDLLFSLATHYQWNLEAWALFPNHYHFIARSPENASSLKKFLIHFHANSARKINLLHHTPGRQVWFQYWDKHLTFHNSYLTRLNYVIQNPVKHKLVKEAGLYKWSSASWFEQFAEKTYYKTVINFKIDDVDIYDDF